MIRAIRFISLGKLDCSASVENGPPSTALTESGALQASQFDEVETLFSHFVRKALK